MAVLGRRQNRDARPAGRWALRHAVLALASFALACAGAPTVLAEGPALEYAVKANYLVKLAPFVGWPPRSFSGQSRSFDICVVGEDPFGSALDEAARGQSVDGRPVTVRRLRSVEPGSGCHVVYVGRSRESAEDLRTLHGAPVLTVTDDRSGVNGGVVRFVVSDGRVRFVIDLAAAQAANLTLSSKLLALALSVQHGPD
jgi:hypothetical protein